MNWNGLSAPCYVAGPDENLCHERWIRLSMWGDGAAVTEREEAETIVYKMDR